MSNRQLAVAEAKNHKAQKPHNRYGIAPASGSVDKDAFFVGGYNTKLNRWEELVYISGTAYERVTHLLEIDGKLSSADLPWEEVHGDWIGDPNDPDNPSTMLENMVLDPALRNPDDPLRRAMRRDGAIRQIMPPLVVDPPQS